MKNLIYWFLLFFVVSSCTDRQTEKQKKSEMFPVESNYIINLDGKTEPHIPYSDYFKSPKTIILETTNDCLIGNIHDLQVVDGFIYIIDTNHAKSVFVFDKNGRFIRKIGSLGGGPGEYIQLMDFTIDIKNNFIFLLDYGKYVHMYTLDGTFVKTINPKIENYNIKNIQYFNNRLYMSVIAFKPTPGDFMLIEIGLEKGEILSKSLPLRYNKNWTEFLFLRNSFFVSRSNVQPLYAQSFMDYIVSVGVEITPYVELKSNNLVTNKDIKAITDTRGDGKAKLDAVKTHFIGNLKIFDVHSYVENEKFFLFRYQQGWGKHCTAIVDKKERTASLTQDFRKDLIFIDSHDLFFSGFACYDSKGAYEILQSISIKRFQESIRNNEVIPDLDKANELLNLDAESNPVIFYYEFK